MKRETITTESNVVVESLESLENSKRFDEISKKLGKHLLSLVYYENETYRLFDNVYAALIKLRTLGTKFSHSEITFIIKYFLESSKVTAYYYGDSMEMLRSQDNISESLLAFSEPNDYVSYIKVSLIEVLRGEIRVGQARGIFKFDIKAIISIVAKNWLANFDNVKEIVIPVEG